MIPGCRVCRFDGILRFRDLGGISVHTEETPGVSSVRYANGVDMIYPLESSTQNTIVLHVATCSIHVPHNQDISNITTLLVGEPTYLNILRDCS